MSQRSPTEAERRAHRFLELAPRDLSACDASELGRQLTLRLAEARASWPQALVDEEGFLLHLASRLRGGADPVAALQGLHLADLALAYSALQGAAWACEEVTRRVLAEPLSAVHGDTPAFREDVRQHVLKLVLVGEPPSRPALAEYAGQGPMAVWLRTVAMHAVFRVRRSDARALQSDVLAPDDEIACADPELQIIKDRYRDDFNAAFAEALANLPTRDRNVLRMYLAEGLNIDRIGVVYRVHRSTVARWIAKSREDLLENTRQNLSRRLSVASSEVDSLIRLLRSQLDVSVGGMLRHK